MMDSPWEIGYGLAHNDACFQISGTEMYSSLSLIISSSGFCFMQDRISVILASCPRWSYGPHQSFLLIILVFGMGIFVCLYLFMNFVLERTLKTNFPGTSLANCAAVPLASLDSANFFDNLKTYHSFFFFRVVFFTLHLFRPSVLTEMLIVLRKAFWPVSSKSSFTIQSHVDILFYL